MSAMCGVKYCEIRGRQLLQCRQCRYQTSLIAGTVLQGTKLPMRVWFRAMHLLAQGKKGLSNIELGRRLGISTNAAWRVQHKLMQAMIERDRRYKLGAAGPRIEIDDAYIGGERTGEGSGRGRRGHTPFIIAVETSKTTDAVGHKINVQETVLEIPPQNVITKDNAVVVVDGIVFYQVFDASRAAYEVRDLELAVSNITMTNIRTAIGALDLDETLSKRDEINERLLRVLDAATEPWGTKITRVELKDVRPPEDVQESMAKQLAADRERRAAILRAEGLKQAAILEAQGAKEAQILAAEGKLEAARREAEARERLAEAEATGHHRRLEGGRRGRCAGAQLFRRAEIRRGDNADRRLAELPARADADGDQRAGRHDRRDRRTRQDVRAPGGVAGMMGLADPPWWAWIVAGRRAGARGDGRARRVSDVDRARRGGNGACRRARPGWSLEGQLAVFAIATAAELPRRLFRLSRSGAEMDRNGGVPLNAPQRSMIGAHGTVCESVCQRARQGADRRYRMARRRPRSRRGSPGRRRRRPRHPARCNAPAKPAASRNRRCAAPDTRRATAFQRTTPRSRSAAISASE